MSVRFAIFSAFGRALDSLVDAPPAMLANRQTKQSGAYSVDQILGKQSRALGLPIFAFRTARPSSPAREGKHSLRQRKFLLSNGRYFLGPVAAVGHVADAGRGGVAVAKQAEVALLSWL